MNGQPLQQTVLITNPLGFHMRPKSVFAQVAGTFRSDVTVCWEDRSVNGKSMMELFLLPAEQGHNVTVKVDGPDAAEALEALVAVLRNTTFEEDAPDPLSRKG
jgi:phosphotransferase system HPr (HPr) family protein